VWSLAMGNPSHLSEELYLILVETSKHFVRDEEASPAVQPHGEQDTVNLIIADIGRTFPAMNLFGANQPLHESLVRLLCAFVMHRPDLGYVSC
jgi:hypothetical protein